MSESQCKPSVARMVRFIVHKASFRQPAPEPWLEDSITIENLKEQLVQHGLGQNNFIYYRSRVKSSDTIKWNISGKNKSSSSYKRMLKSSNKMLMMNPRCRMRLSSSGWLRLNTGGGMTMTELTNDTTFGKMIEEYKSFQMVDLHCYSRPERFVEPAPITDVEHAIWCCQQLWTSWLLGTLTTIYMYTIRIRLDWAITQFSQ